jgi:Zn-dependent protease with chaperone function
MNLLAFVLALGAIAFPTAWAVSAISLLFWPLVRRGSPVTRTEAASGLALLPVLAALLIGAAVAMPSAQAGLGLGPDHCLGHEHHPHLCLWHATHLPPAVALLGAVGWAFWALRTAQVVSGLVRVEGLARDLAATGQRREGYVMVPTSAAVCHAVGLLRPQVLVSEAVAQGLDPRGLRAVIAHERAHLARRDPLWSALFALAGTVAPLTAVWAAWWRHAAEETADDLAAADTDGPTVARALVAVARMRLPEAAGLAFGASHLEHRVLRLLGPRPGARPSAAPLGALVLVGLTAVILFAGDVPLHHEVEEVWEQLVGP